MRKTGRGGREGRETGAGTGEKGEEEGSEMESSRSVLPGGAAAAAPGNLLEVKTGGSAWWPRDEDPALPVQGARVQSLAREVPVLQGAAKKEKENWGDYPSSVYSLRNSRGGDPGARWSDKSCK